MGLEFGFQYGIIINKELCLGGIELCSFAETRERLYRLSHGGALPSAFGLFTARHENKRRSSNTVEMHKRYKDRRLSRANEHYSNNTKRNKHWNLLTKRPIHRMMSHRPIPPPASTTSSPKC
uniref:Uncharacterized protein n=1 Tax=Timema bartmani TaxID=61472 RepID=A0A7R9EYB7_9NEOP|nr:unnamed protein product [Timema bartmani]